MGHRHLPFRTPPLSAKAAPASLLLWGALLLAAGGCAVGCYKPYDVRKGETLSSICSRYGLPERDIRRYNRIEAGYEVQEFDRIFIPCDSEEKERGATASRAVPEEKPDRPKKSRTAPDLKPKPRAPVSTAIRIPTPVKEENVKPSPQLTGNDAFGWPVDGEVVRGFSGAQGAPVNGIDIRAETGAPVLAAAQGRVEYVGTPANAYGPMILLAHDGGLYTVYSHLGALSVESGKSVKKGEKIGAAGSDSYVHFELREGRASVDPLLYLPKR